MGSEKMTLNDLQRAALVLFAARETGAGSLEQMKAVCHCIRNRVMAGWSEGNWLAVIEDATEEIARGMNLTPARLSVNDRRIQALARDVDEIYYGQAADDIAKMCARQDKDHGPLLYWHWIDRPVSPWMEQEIIRKPCEHAQRGIVGFLYLYE
jgi:hypothetical protein